MIEYFDTSIGYVNEGVCVSCAGQSDYRCFCISLNTSHCMEFISNQIEYLKMPDTKPQSKKIKKFLRNALKSQKTRRKCLNKRQLTNDNDAHKLISVVMKDVYKQITNCNLPRQFQGKQCRKSFFILILCCLEKFTPNLKEISTIFKRKIETQFIPKGQIRYANKPLKMELLLRLCPRYIKAFQVYNQGGYDCYVESSKIIYDYDNLKQSLKVKFWKSLQDITELRKQYGLSIIPNLTN